MFFFVVVFDDCCCCIFWDRSTSRKVWIWLNMCGICFDLLKSFLAFGDAKPPGPLGCDSMRDDKPKLRLSSESQASKAELPQRIVQYTPHMWHIYYWEAWDISSFSIPYTEKAAKTEVIHANIKDLYIKVLLNNKIDFSKLWSIFLLDTFSFCLLGNCRDNTSHPMTVSIIKIIFSVLNVLLLLFSANILILWE